MLQKHSKSEFEYLKEMFIIIPDKRFKILKNKINKIKEIKKREKKTDVTR